MIERKNIIKILGDRTNVYHSAILTCYCFDSIFFESIYLPTLRSLGISNVVIFMDANIYDQLLCDGSYQYHSIATNKYTLVRQENKYNGVFHPKVTLLFGEEEGALIVGSGNLTFSGLTNNEEVWNVFHVKGSESLHFTLLQKSWKYIERTAVSASSLVQRQLDWITEQSPWIKNRKIDQTVTLNSGEECYLLYNSPERNIIDDLNTYVGHSEIKEITVVAPFYDSKGAALLDLQKLFRPKKFKCILDTKRQSAPYDLLEHESDIVFLKSTAVNPLHAKIFEIQGVNETWLLSGSANAGEMALGVNPFMFNDEVCILLHSKTIKNYIKDLGIASEVLKADEKKSIKRPDPQPPISTPWVVSLFSCEEKDSVLYLRFSKSNINGTLCICDSQQNTIFQKQITTKKEIKVELGEINDRRIHMVVLKGEDVEMSNRVLIIREVHIENCNPDPKRRKLTSLLNDDDLLQNLSHILGYIEFDDINIKPYKTAKSEGHNKEEEVIVKRDRFNVLKDSSLSINMHAGVRILAYLQQILFKEDVEMQTDDNLLELVEEGSEVAVNELKEDKVKENPDDLASHAKKRRAEIFNFLKKMKQFLLEKTKDKQNHGKKHPAVGKPMLTAAPGLNSASSLAVAARAIVCVVNKYGFEVSRSVKIRDLLMQCAGLFFALYGNNFPLEVNSRSNKIREIIKDASVDLLTALSFFSFTRKEMTFPQLVLNCLDFWKGRYEQSLIMPLYKEQLKKLKSEYLEESTIKRIQEIGNTYLKRDIPVQDFPMSDSTVLLYRNGYGFFIVDDIKYSGDGWSYSIHFSWFDIKIDFISATLFKGYIDI